MNKRNQRIKDAAIAIGAGIVGGACAIAVIAEVPMAAAGAGAIVIASAACKRLMNEDENGSE